MGGESQTSVAHEHKSGAQHDDAESGAHQGGAERLRDEECASADSEGFEKPAVPWHSAPEFLDLPEGFIITADQLPALGARFKLTNDQLLAFMMVGERLLFECDVDDIETTTRQSDLAGVLRLLVLGAGGSGKTRVIP